MKKLHLLALSAVASTQLLSAAHAAPLDALLSANKPTVPGKVEIEAAYDVVNSKVDVFNVRDSDKDFAGTNVGDYHGAHLRAGVAVTPSLWLDGGLWQRKLDYRQDQAKVNSWQLAAQYKFLDGKALVPTMAARVGAWGNYADSLDKTSPTKVSGVTLNSVSVKDPSDRQFQADLIASWPVLQQGEVSAFIGGGASRVKLGSVSGTATQNGCNYNLAFGRSEVTGTLAQFCNAGVVIDRFTLANSTVGINVFDEAEYRARFMHAGLSAKWLMGNWQLRAGYDYQRVNRDSVDDSISRRGGKPVEDNHTLVGEVMYRVTNNVSLFGRGQLMKRQFTGEIPFAYNSLTAGRFDKKYGFVTAGVVMQF
jgi:hypothetical protein